MRPVLQFCRPLPYSVPPLQKAGRGRRGPAGISAYEGPLAIWVHGVPPPKEGLGSPICWILHPPRYRTVVQGRPPASSVQGRKSTAEAGQKAWMTCGAGEERTIPALERSDLI
ncbi:unnamed protein product [Menidia menidia]|uniref:(Atlantic silverside) hypothetical protein n=1 Tax=Menidia menidia TaxID=238744 RepID=A0A8S4BJG1_9TELE|nr:unnamed protein product [Menidia menidia]